MRKARTWLVSPARRENGSETEDRIIVQADDAIGIFDPRTGQGRLTTKGGYYPHLALAKPFQFPAEFVADCLRACPAMDSTVSLGGGAVIADTTVTIVG